MEESIFEEDVRGFLFFSSRSMDQTEKYKLILEYNPNVLLKLREGDIVAVESFTNLSSTSQEKIYTLLEVTSTNPTHITVDRLKKFRFMGSVREFLEKATKDFEEDPRLIRDHVYIEADAIPTGYVMGVYGDKVEYFRMEPTKPILGRDVGLLKAPDVIERLLNRNIEPAIEVGTLYAVYEKKKQVRIKINPYKMITHHYSVFGFTGHGKSNLNSILIEKLLQKPGLNVIIFDLSDEYTGLIPDILEKKGLLILYADEAPDSLIDFFSTEAGNTATPENEQRIRRIASEMAVKTKKPGIFDSETFEDTYQEVFHELIKDKRIKLLDLTMRNTSLEQLDFHSFMSELRRICDQNQTDRLKMLEPILEEELRKNAYIRRDDSGNFVLSKSNLDAFHRIIIDKCFQRLSWQSSGQFAPGIVGCLESLFAQARLRMEPSEGELKIQENRMNIQTLLEVFIQQIDPGKRLAIISIADKSKMADVIELLINESLRIRRKRGTKPHDVLFVIDEAHEFLLNPNQRGVSPEEQRSSRAIEKLTRMGRKYGLGVCISSQRVAYLNTTALSNCHTTFIGAIPREYDRATLNQAYGISIDILSQAMIFPSGHWFAVSSNSMGMKNIPIRFVAENRESELVEYFRKRGFLSKDVSLSPER